MQEGSPLSDSDFTAAMRGIAALEEPTRRALYKYVAGSEEPVGRDQAAKGVGVPRHVAKFHLDKLVDAGLLEFEFRRPPERTGPGAGRPAKLYRRSSSEFSLSVPARRYDLAGRIMLQAITAAVAADLPVAAALDRAADDVGKALGQQARARLGARPSRAAVLGAARDVLDRHGFEPRSTRTALTLSNCPFRELAMDFPDVVCRLNLDLVTGLLTGLRADTVEARLDPAADRCCVTITPSSRRRSTLGSR